MCMYVLYEHVCAHMYMHFLTIACKQAVEHRLVGTWTNRQAQTQAKRHIDTKVSMHMIIGSHVQENTQSP